MNKEAMNAAHAEYKQHLRYVKVSIQWGSPYKIKTFGQFLKRAWGLVKNKYEESTGLGGEMIDGSGIDFAML